MTPAQACEIAKKLPDIAIKDHFGSDGFSANKRMFLTIWYDKDQANIRLSPSQQKDFLVMDGDAFSEIENAWGRQGWTIIHLKFIDKALFEKALKAAWEYSAQKAPKTASSSKKSVTKKRRI
jgi:hypothetical protein